VKRQEGEQYAFGRRCLETGQGKKVQYGNTWEDRKKEEEACQGLAAGKKLGRKKTEPVTNGNKHDYKGTQKVTGKNLLVAIRLDK